MTANLALTMLIALNLAMVISTIWAIRVIGRDMGFWD